MTVESTENVVEVTELGDVSRGNVSDIKATGGTESVVEAADAPEVVPWIIHYGVPVTKSTCLEDEKIFPATCGRTKIPLAKLVMNGIDLSCGNSDIYISVVIIKVDIDGRKMSASDLVITGSTEVEIFVDDISPMNGMRWETMTGSSLLILNPVPQRKGLTLILWIPSLKNCMRIGRLIENLEICSHDQCDKPVFIPRDGNCCFKHASQRAGLRTGFLGGEHAGGTTSLQSVAPKRKQRPVLDPAEKAARIEAQKRAEFLARKKTAILLANRGGGSGPSHVQLNGFGSRGQEDDGELMMELGDEKGEKDDSKIRLERFAALKRKRETIERDDLKRRSIAEQPEPSAPENIPPPIPVEPNRRQSLLLEMESLIKTERGGFI